VGPPTPTPVFTVSVDVWPDPVSTTDAGEKVQVTLSGTPGQLSPTVPVNPLTAPTVTLKVVESIELTVREEGEAETEKSVPVPESGTDCGLPLTLSVMDRVPLCVPVAVGVKVT